jgi:AcrR family transcriptional regulator
LTFHPHHAQTGCGIIRWKARQMAKKPIGEIREQLIEITLDLLDQGGLEAVRARTIASQAGISLGSIYNYVGTIDDLLVLANSRILDELETVSQRAATPETPSTTFPMPSDDYDEMSEQLRLVRHRLLVFADGYMEFVRRYNNRWSALLAFNQNLHTAAQLQDYLRQQDALLDLIGQALSDTSIARTSEGRRLASRALWAGVHGITILGYLDQTGPKARREAWNQINILVTTFVNGLVH